MRPPRPAGPIEAIEPGHVLIADREVEQVEVLADPIPMRGLWDHDRLTLQRPPQQHLGGGPTDPAGDIEDGRIFEIGAPRQWAVGLERDPLASAGRRQTPAILEGVELDLVDGRADGAAADQLAGLG